MNDNERERIIQKIMKEANHTRNLAITALEQLDKVPQALKEVVDCWKEGKEIPFEHNGISISDIMEKERINYFHAIFTMCVFLENPDLAEGYMDRKFGIDDKWD